MKVVENTERFLNMSVIKIRLMCYTPCWQCEDGLEEVRLNKIQQETSICKETEEINPLAAVLSIQLEENPALFGKMVC